MEVPAFPSVLWPAYAGLEPDACVECAAPVRHGLDRYYQRNDAGDGAGRSLEDALLALTYDCVCARCGDAAIREAAS